MEKYWTANKSKELVDYRRTELDFLFKFANADIVNEKNESLQARIIDQLCQHRALHPDNRNWKVKGMDISLAGTLQNHLHSQLLKIIKNREMLWEMPLWKINGSVQFVLLRGGKQFEERFQLRKVKEGNVIDALRKVLDLWLIEIIRDLDFDPQRFGQCLKCRAFFYNKTAKKKKYCSTRCSNAMRQEKFRKKSG